VAATFYSFDTSALINGHRDLLPPDTFPSVWHRIEASIAQGAVRCVDEVERELAKREGDTVHRWARAQRGLFVPLTPDVQEATMQVLGAHPRLVGAGKGRSAADPFVIALALAHGGVVVTQEHRGSLDRPKIPVVCEALGVRSVTLVQFVAEQGWSF